jgi:hypothetical protein
MSVWRLSHELQRSLSAAEESDTKARGFKLGGYLVIPNVRSRSLAFITALNFSVSKQCERQILSEKSPFVRRLSTRGGKERKRGAELLTTEPPTGQPQPPFLTASSVLPSQPQQPMRLIRHKQGSFIQSRFCEKQVPSCY